MAPIDDETLGLKQGDPYYVLTTAKGVDGLKEFVLEVVPAYELATETKNGLFAKEDKIKLDHLDPEEIEKRLKWLEDHIKE